MTQQSNSPFFAFNQQFADNAAQVQALAMKSLASVSQLQASEFGHQAKASSALVAEAMALRDTSGLQSVLEKGGNLGRDSVERNVALTQEVIAITQKTAESITALLHGQHQAVNDTVASPHPAAKKAASK